MLILKKFKPCLKRLVFKSPAVRILDNGTIYSIAIA